MMGIATLLRFAQQAVQTALQQYTQQMNVVQEQAFNPLQAILQEVENGAWKGVGADAFKEELSNLHMPGVTQIFDHGQLVMKNFQQAGQIITQADQAAHQAIQGLDEVFHKIATF